MQTLCNFGRMKIKYFPQLVGNKGSIQCRRVKSGSVCNEKGGMWTTGEGASKEKNNEGERVFV
jgi:hypothetical protein